MMNKFINDPDNLTAELLEGYVMAYSNQAVEFRSRRIGYAKQHIAVIASATRIIHIFPVFIVLSRRDAYLFILYLIVESINR